MTHTTKQVVQLALEGEQVWSILMAAKAITKTFKASPTAKHMLAECQAPKIDNKTLWGAAHAMLKRLISSCLAVSACMEAKKRALKGCSFRMHKAD